MAYELILDDPLPGVIDALPDALYTRVNDLLDALEIDPTRPKFPGFVHPLRDAANRPMSGLSVRAGADEVAVVWQVVDDQHVKVAYIGSNETLRW